VTRGTDPPTMLEILAYRDAMLEEVLEVWNAALGDRFPLTRELFLQNAVHSPHFDPGGCLVARMAGRGKAVGICLAKVAREPLGADGWLPDLGWISLLAVHPAHQRRGIGRALLERSERYLRDHGRHRVALGGDPDHFVPGVPTAGDAQAFFAAMGYDLRGDAYDLRRSLLDYTTPPEVASTLAAHPDVEIRPLRSDDAPRLLAFLDDVFPGRWRYTIARFLDRGGPPGDVMGVVRRGAVNGFALLFRPRPGWMIGPSIAWARSVRGPAGGLGPMGLAPGLRGRGLGLALLDRSVRRLADLGMEEVVIDWTGLLEFYGRLGFTPWRHYRHGEKRL
jgi:GNAT superfamily N-acetyltransferase